MAIIKTGASAGNTSCVLTYTDPVGGSVSRTLATTQVSGAANAVAASALQAITKGDGPVTVTNTPAGVSGGPPVLDLYLFAQRIGSLP